MQRIKLEVSDEAQARFDTCCEKIVEIISECLPEVRESWKKRDPNSFVQRVCMTMYLEMIHAGFFDKDKTKSV